MIYPLIFLVLTSFYTAVARDETVRDVTVDIKTDQTDDSLIVVDSIRKKLGEATVIVRHCHPRAVTRIVKVVEDNKVLWTMTQGKCSRVTTMIKNGHIVIVRLAVSISQATYEFYNFERDDNGNLVPIDENKLDSRWKYHLGESSGAQARGDIVLNIGIPLHTGCVMSLSKNGSLTTYKFVPKTDDNYITKVFDNFTLIWDGTDEDARCIEVYCNTMRRTNKSHLVKIVFKAEGDEKPSDLCYANIDNKWLVVTSEEYDAIFEKYRSTTYLDEDTNILVDVSSNSCSSELTLTTSKSGLMTIYKYVPMYDRYYITAAKDGYNTIWDSHIDNRKCLDVTTYVSEDAYRTLLVMLTLSKKKKTEIVYYAYDQNRRRWYLVKTRRTFERLLDKCKNTGTVDDLSDVNIGNRRCSSTVVISSCKGQVLTTYTFVPKEDGTFVSRVYDNFTPIWDGTADDAKCIEVVCHVISKTNKSRLVKLTNYGEHGVTPTKYYSNKDGKWTSVDVDEYDTTLHILRSTTYLDQETNIYVDLSNKVCSSEVTLTTSTSGLMTLCTYVPMYDRYNITAVKDNFYTIWDSSIDNRKCLDVNVYVSTTIDVPLLVKLTLTKKKVTENAYYSYDLNGRKWVSVKYVNHFDKLLERCKSTGSIINVAEVDIGNRKCSNTVLVSSSKSKTLTTYKFVPKDDDDFITKVSDGVTVIWDNFYGYDKCIEVVCHVVNKTNKCHLFKIVSEGDHGLTPTKYYTRKDGKWTLIDADEYDAAYDKYQTSVFLDRDVSISVDVETKTCSEDVTLTTSTLELVTLYKYVPMYDRCKITAVRAGPNTIWDTDIAGHKCVEVTAYVSNESNETLLVKLTLTKKKVTEYLYYAYDVNGKKWYSIKYVKYFDRLLERCKSTGSTEDAAEVDVGNKCCTNTVLLSVFKSKTLTTLLFVPKDDGDSITKVRDGFTGIWDSSEDNNKCLEVLCHALNHTNKTHLVKLSFKNKDGKQVPNKYFVYKDGKWTSVNIVEYDLTFEKYNSATFLDKDTNVSVDVETKTCSDELTLTTSKSGLMTLYQYVPINEKYYITAVKDNYNTIWDNSVDDRKCLDVTSYVSTDNLKTLLIQLTLEKDKKTDYLYYSYDLQSRKWVVTKKREFNASVKKLKAGKYGLNDYILDLSSTDPTSACETSSYYDSNVLYHERKPAKEYRIAGVDFHAQELWNGGTKYSCTFAVTYVDLTCNMTCLMRLTVTSKGSRSNVLYFIRLDGIWNSVDSKKFHESYNAVKNGKFNHTSDEKELDEADDDDEVEGDVDGN